MKSYTVRDWVTIGLFGALWGAVELTLGSALHAIYPPLANTPLTGVILTGVGVAVTLTGRRFVPRRGSVLLTGVVTAIIKLLSISGVKIGPAVAILIESAIMECVLIARTPHLWAFVVSGALAVGWNLPHMLIMPQILLGKSSGEAFNKVVRQGGRFLGLDPSAASLILAALLLMQLVVGGISGWGAWKLGDAATRRLGSRGAAASEGDP
jgi:ABC-type thiamin/hydroxymethylpyrimidine transport system permease subunit